MLRAGRAWDSWARAMRVAFGPRGLPGDSGRQSVDRHSRVPRWSWTFAVIVVIVPVVTACSLPVQLPDGFWDIVHDAAVTGQRAQGEAWSLVKAHENRAKLLEQRIGLRAMLMNPSDLMEIAELPLDLWLNEDKYAQAIMDYQDTAVLWNAIYDTALALIGANRSITDWPAFAKKISAASEAATTFHRSYDAAHRAAKVAKKAAMDRAARAKILAESATTMDADKLDAAVEKESKAAATAPTAASSDAFSFFSGPLIKGPFDLVDIATKIGDMNDKTRAGLTQALTGMKWLTVACLQDAKDRTCPTTAAAEKTSSTPSSKGSSDQTK